MKKTRLSANGFYCADCGKWTYVGYDKRDSDGIKNAICIECGKNYEEINK